MSRWPISSLCGVLLSFAYVLVAGCNDVSSVSTPPTAPTAPTAPAALAITTASLPPGMVGQAYNASVGGSGGTPPYSWLVTPSLPSGLSFNGSTGAITGTPASNTVGTTTHTFVLQDGASNSDAQILTLTINPANLTITPITLPPGVVNQLYQTTTMTATGGVAPYTWSVSPALPNGLQFNVASPGTISGIPLNGTIGTTIHTFTVIDTSTPRQTASTVPPLSLTITSLWITTNSLPNAKVNQNYNFQIQRSGGIPPFTWSVSSALPQELSFTTTGNSGGTISGKPANSTQGNHPRTYTVQDSSNPKQSFSKSLTLTITN